MHVNWTGLTFAVPSFVIGVLLGPVCANLVDARRWGSHVEEGQIAYVSDPTEALQVHVADPSGLDATGHWHPDG